MKKVALTVAVAVLAAVAAVTAFGRTGASPAPAAMHAGHMHAAKVSAADLRVTLDRLLGEHALLAVNATQRGYSGGKDFPAVAKSLDRNSVELSQAIGLVFGKPAGQKFLNGKFLWRDHIRYFVAYTQALAKKDKRGQAAAVNSLKGYTAAFSAFLSSATGLPQPVLAKGLTEHVMQLKGQIDAYAAGDYARSTRLTRSAYAHMIMTGDTLAAAIAKKYPQRFAA